SAVVKISVLKASCAVCPGVNPVTSLLKPAVTSSWGIASAATTLSKLAGVVVGNVLISGGVTTAPGYGKVAIAHLDSDLKGEGALGAGTDIDWDAYITFTKTLAAAWTVTFSNPIVGKVIMVVTTGNYTITWPTGVDASADFADYDGTKRNVHFLTCVSTSIPLYSGSVKAYTI
ncbi:hypothetical protein LCGC14_2711290, partial [marine sediment metagenome]